MMKNTLLWSLILSLNFILFAKAETIEEQIKRMEKLEKKFENYNKGISLEERKLITYHWARLGKVCDNDGLDIRNLEVEDIKFLLTKRTEYFVGDITEGYKYNTLKLLCNIIKKHDEKIKLRDHVYHLFMSLTPIKGQAKGWDQGMVEDSGAYIGLFSDCLSNICANDALFLGKVVDDLISKKDLYRFSLLMEDVAYYSNEKLISSIKEKTKDLEGFRKILNKSIERAKRTKKAILERKKEAIQKKSKVE